MRYPLPDSRRLPGTESQAVRWQAAEWDPRVSTGAAAPAGVAITFAATAAISPVRSSLGIVAGTVVMVLVVSLTGWFASSAATFATAGVAWLMLNGFVEDRYGVLRWHGRVDLDLLGVLLISAAAMTSLRQAQIHRRRRAVVRRTESELEDMAYPTDDTPGERHD